MELYITFSIFLAFLYTSLWEILSHDACLHFHFSYLNLIVSCIFAKLYIFITMFSMKYESESGFIRLLNLILEKNASDSRLLRPSRAEVGKYYTVFFVFRSINTCLVGEMWLCSTLCINLFLLDNG